MSDAPPSADDSGTATIAVGGVVIALALIFVVLRFYVRITSRARLWWDDWLIAAAVVSTLATAGLLLWGKVCRHLLRTQMKRDSLYIMNTTANLFT